MVMGRVIWMADMSSREGELEMMLMTAVRGELMSSLRDSVSLRMF
jgi:hypothetical protein